MFKNKKALWIACAFIFAIGLVACGNDSDTGSTENGGGEANENDRLVVVIGANPNNMDIHGTNDVNSSLGHRHVFSTLVVQTPDLEIVPGLATDWRQIDDVTWEFDLEEGF